MCKPLTTFSPEYFKRILRRKANAGITGIAFSKLDPLNVDIWKSNDPVKIPVAETEFHPQRIRHLEREVKPRRLT